MALEGINGFINISYNTRVLYADNILWRHWIPRSSTLATSVFMRHWVTIAGPLGGVVLFQLYKAETRSFIDRVAPCWLLAS